MIEDIRKLAEAAPFVPFTLHTADGGALRVPTTDHVAFPPDGKRVLVWSDGHLVDIIRATMITRVTVDRDAHAA